MKSNNCYNITMCVLYRLYTGTMVQCRHFDINRLLQKNVGRVGVELDFHVHHPDKIRRTAVRLATLDC